LLRVLNFKGAVDIVGGLPLSTIHCSLIPELLARERLPLGHQRGLTGDRV
jgi:hypothetical protein